LQHMRICYCPIQLDRVSKELVTARYPTNPHSLQPLFAVAVSVRRAGACVTRFRCSEHPETKNV